MLFRTRLLKCVRNATGKRMQCQVVSASYSKHSILFYRMKLDEKHLRNHGQIHILTPLKTIHFLLKYYRYSKKVGTSLHKVYIRYIHVCVCLRQWSFLKTYYEYGSRNTKPFLFRTLIIHIQEFTSFGTKCFIWSSTHQSRIFENFGRQ